MTPSPRPSPSAKRAENAHHARADLTRHRVLLHGRTLAGTPDMTTALRLLAVLSRDGELAGFRIVTRGGR